MRLEKKATVVSTSVAAILVIIKITIGILSGSVAVLASAIDSFLDLLLSMFNYFALHNSEKEADEQFHFGRTKIEPLAAVIEGTVIILSALFIFFEAIKKINSANETTYLTESIAVMIVSIFITAFLVIFLNYVAKKTQNIVIKADSLHYKTDLYANIAVLFALVAISYTGEQLIDPMVGIGIAIYMIYSSIPIIKDGVLMLLDAALEKEDIDKIIQIIQSESIITNYHYLKTRQSGSHIFISVHAVFNDNITLYDAHMIADRVEDKIRECFLEKTSHILIHMDPYDDSLQESN